MRYASDDLKAACEDLDNASVMAEILGRFKVSIRYRAATLNQNADLAEQFLTLVDECFHDTIAGIIRQAKEAGATETLPAYSRE
jgi:hypothetical protein